MNTDASDREQTREIATTGTTLEESRHGIQDSSENMAAETESAQKHHSREVAKYRSPSKHVASRSIDVLEYRQTELPKIHAEKHNFPEEVAKRNLGSSPRQHDNNEKPAGSIAHRLKQKVQQILPNKFTDVETNGTGEHGLPPVNRKPLELDSIRQLISKSPQSPETGSETQDIHLNNQNKNELASVGVNLDSITETFQHTHLASAVTKEKVQPLIQEVQTEKVTRDVHNTHIIHRILPIKETEILPARHFVKSPSGELIEVAEADVDKALGLS
jgi:hypothetical protein